MRCPSCGACYSDAECCVECGTDVLEFSERDGNPPGNSFAVTCDVESSRKDSPAKSTLIEFPGVTRNTVPEWRRELGDRVRVVQERRAREAAKEAAEAQRRRLAEEAAAAVGQLELLPQADTPPLNPLVAAALRRIERANHKPNHPAATVLLPQKFVATIADDDDQDFETIVDAAASRNDHKNVDLIVDRREESPKRFVVTAAENGKSNRSASSTGARRLLREDDGVLDYLAPIAPTIRLDEIRERQAGSRPRIFAALIDLAVCALFFSPFAVVVHLIDGEWLAFYTALFAVGFAALVIFLYLTFCIALTGRTLGMRLFSLRTVDRKTGLIPTGAQSVGRAALFLVSLFALGLPMLYALLQRDGHSAQDQLTGTVVVRA